MFTASTQADNAQRTPPLYIIHIPENLQNILPPHPHPVILLISASCPIPPEDFQVRPLIFSVSSITQLTSHIKLKKSAWALMGTTWRKVTVIEKTNGNDGAHLISVRFHSPPHQYQSHLAPHRKPPRKRAQFTGACPTSARAFWVASFSRLARTSLQIRRLGALSLRPLGAGGRRRGRRTILLPA